MTQSNLDRFIEAQNKVYDTVIAERNRQNNHTFLI